jgi:hypothetical protein
LVRKRLGEEIPLSMRLDNKTRPDRVAVQLAAHDSFLGSSPKGSEPEPRGK